MPDPFPNFLTPAPLSGGRTWTATCESYDMRLDAAYYFVTVTGPQERAFFVRVGVSDGVPEADYLRRQIAPHAERGEPNTAYEGSVMWQLTRLRGGTE